MGWPGPMTQRQYLAWHQWVELDNNAPGKTEYYLMAIRGDIAAACGVKDVDANKMRVKIVRKRPEKKPRQATPEERKQAAALSKAAWGMRVGGGVAYVTPEGIDPAQYARDILTGKVKPPLPQEQ